MVEVKPFVPSQHIETLEDVLEYLRAASEVEDDGSHLASAALNVVRALSDKPKGRMMVEVTQEDRRSAGQIFELLDAEQLSTSNVQNILAHHRIAAEQRGKLEGARLAIEAISLIIHDQDRETVAALDPAKIVDLA